MKMFKKLQILLLACILVPILNFAQINQTLLTIGGAGDDVANGMDIDPSGNWYLTGSFMGQNVDFDPGPLPAFMTAVGKLDIWIAKYNSLGKYLWVKAIGNLDKEYANKTCYDSKDNWMVTGGFLGSPAIDFDASQALEIVFNPGNECGFVMIYNSIGNYVNAWVIGGDTKAEVMDVACDNSGNVYVTGFVSGKNINFVENGSLNAVAKGSKDFFIAKYDSNGNLKWQRMIGKSGSECKGMGINVTGSGEIVVTGYFTGNGVDFNPGGTPTSLSSAGDKDAFLAKYNTSGVNILAMALGGSAEDIGRSAIHLPNSAIAVTGEFQSISLNLDPLGSSKIVSTKGDRDVFIAKYNSTGKMAWGDSFGGTSNDSPSEIAEDVNGDIFFTGGFNSSKIDFGGRSISTNGNEDVLMGAYTKAGTFKWASNIGSSKDDRGNSLDFDATGSLVLCGSFSGSDMNFNPAGTPNIIASNGSKDWFAGSYNQLPTGISTPGMIEAEISFYPNPVSDYIQLGFGDNMKNNTDVQLRVYDLTGRLVFQSVGDRVKLESDLQSFIPAMSKGFYNLEFISKEYRTVKKLVKQ
jgi:Secretion system C-terminal sorting domain